MKNGLYEKRLCSAEGETIFLLNSTDTAKVVQIQEKGYLVEGSCKLESGTLTIPPLTVAVFVANRI